MAKLDELREKYQSQLGGHLRKVSRTFALTIPFLDICAGSNESLKAFPTLLCYLDARLVDAIEDSKHLGRDKIDLYQKLSGFRSSGPISGWRMRWGEFVKKALENDADGNCKIINPAEADMIKNYEPVWECFWAQDERIKGNTNLWLPEMASVMGHFDAPGAIKTFGELDHYCFGVASTVGLWLKSLVEMMDGISLVRYTETFGKGLQYVNVGRDVGDDFRSLGKIWWPNLLYDGMSVGEFITGDSERARNARSGGLEKMVDKTIEHMDGSVKYVKSIPSTIPGYGTFCGANYILAMETVKRMVGNEAVFSEEGGVKLTRGAVGNVIHHATLSGNCTPEWYSRYFEATNEWVSKAYRNLKEGHLDGIASFVEFTEAENTYRQLADQAQEFARRGDAESAKHASGDAEKVKKNAPHILRGNDARLRNNPDVYSFEEGVYSIGNEDERNAIHDLIYKGEFAPLAVIYKRKQSS